MTCPCLINTTYLVEQLVEYAEFVGCKQERSHGYGRRASQNGADGSEWFHVGTRK